MNSIDQAFNEGYNKARRYYYKDQIEDCIEKSRELLADTAIPRYHQIRFLILLGATVEDGVRQETITSRLNLYGASSDVGIIPRMNKLWWRSIWRISANRSMN
jgi:hypothetical protein